MLLIRMLERNSFSSLREVCVFPLLETPQMEYYQAEIYLDLKLVSNILN